MLIDWFFFRFALRMEDLRRQNELLHAQVDSFSVQIKRLEVRRLFCEEIGGWCFPGAVSNTCLRQCVLLMCFEQRAMRRAKSSSEETGEGDVEGGVSEQEDLESSADAESAAADSNEKIMDVVCFNWCLKSDSWWKLLCSV
mgnify:CR=1 FL=1